MNYIEGNILDTSYGIIAHQVNCQLVMGSGLAKQVRDKYPHVFKEYTEVMSRIPTDKRLGKCQMVIAVPGKVMIANLFGQLNYLPRGIQHTDYSALGMALRHLQRWRERFSPNVQVYVPEGIGCGLGGGDWEIVKGIVLSAIKDVTIVRLNSEV